jgi:hypothetical protein
MSGLHAERTAPAVAADRTAPAGISFDTQPPTEFMVSAAAATGALTMSAAAAGTDINATTNLAVFRMMSASDWP